MSATPNTDAYNDPAWIAENERLLEAAQVAMLALMRHVAQPYALIALFDGEVLIGEARIHMVPSYTFPTN